VGLHYDETTYVHGTCTCMAHAHAHVHVHVLCACTTLVRSLVHTMLRGVCDFGMQQHTAHPDDRICQSELRGRVDRLARWQGEVERYQSQIDERVAAPIRVGYQPPAQRPLRCHRSTSLPRCCVVAAVMPRLACHCPDVCFCARACMLCPNVRFCPRVCMLLPERVLLCTGLHTIARTCASVHGPACCCPDVCFCARGFSDLA